MAYAYDYEDKGFTPFYQHNVSRLMNRRRQGHVPDSVKMLQDYFLNKPKPNPVFNAEILRQRQVHNQRHAYNQYAFENQKQHDREARLNAAVLALQQPKPEPKAKDENKENDNFDFTKMPLTAEALLSLEYAGLLGPDGESSLIQSVLRMGTVDEVNEAVLNLSNTPRPGRMTP